MRINKMSETFKTSLDLELQTEDQKMLEELECNVQGPRYLGENVNKTGTVCRQVESKQANNNINTVANIENIKNRRLNSIHGNIYQLKLLMLFLWRGVSHQYSFRLGTEIKEANKFDDLVFEYIQHGKKVYRLLQAKHKIDESKRITVHNLLTESNGSYNLIKYFFSYQKCKQEGLFKDGLIKDITICTNIDWDFDDLDRARVTVERIQGKDDILDIQSSEKHSKRYRFNQSVGALLKLELKNYSKLRSGNPVMYSDNKIKDFLNHLVFAVNQPNEEELGKIIKEEIGKEFDFIMTENVYNKFFMTILDWLQGKKRDSFLSYKDGKGFFEKIRLGIPIWFNVRQPIESFSGRTKELDHLHTLLQGKDASEKSQPVLINGLGGVGKSELARMYINRYSQSYENKIIWINAQGYETLVESFRRLASDKLGIITQNANGEEKEVSSIIEDVYKFFSGGRSLFIFDDAERYKSQNKFDHGIDKFLPVLPSNYNGLRVLITSRNQKWPKNVQILHLDVFSKEEAMQFISIYLNIKDGEQKEDIKDLAEQLNFFPLALQQAVAYISVQDKRLRLVGSKFEISSYLKRYREKAREVLNFELPEDSDNDYTKTVFTTWNMTLHKIKQKENGSDALEILNIISYFAPEHIPIEMFSNIVGDKEKLASAIELLMQYSMINSKNTLLNVHQLVQKVTRMHLKEQNREIEILINALHLFDKDNMSLKDVYHAMSVWNYLSKYEELVKQFLYFTSYIGNALMNSARYEEAYLFGENILELLNTVSQINVEVVEGLWRTMNTMGLALVEQGKYDIALKTLEKALYVHNIIGSDNVNSLLVLGNIAEVLSKQGKYDTALKYYQEIYDGKKVMLGNDHPETLSVKDSIATTLNKNGKFIEALSMLQEIYNVKKVTLGTSHSETLAAKHSIATALLDQGRHDESLQILQELYNDSTVERSDSFIESIEDDIAGVYISQGNYSDALEIYQKIYNAKKNILGEDHLDVLISHRQVAEVLRGLKQYDIALEKCEEILRKQKDILDFDHPDIIKTQFTIALIFDNQEKYSNALPIYQEILQKGRTIYGDNHPIIVKARNCIAAIYSELGDYDRAFPEYQEILSVQTRTLGERHLETLSTKNNLGMLYYYNNRNEKAARIFQECLDVIQSAYPNHPAMWTAKNNIASVFSRQGKYGEALKLFREVLDYQEATFGKDHPSVITVKSDIASLLVKQGKQNEALNAYHEILKISDNAFGSEHPETVKIANTIKSLSMMVNNRFTERNDNARLLRNLVIKRGGINNWDNDGRTQLHYAVNNGNINTVNVLLKIGADVTQVTKKGNTPLHTAVANGYNEMVDLILQHVSREKLNTFINAKTTGSGTTSLHVAAEKGFLEIVKSLLKHGAIWNIKNKRNKTPVSVSNNRDITKLLKLVEGLFVDAESGNVEMISKLRAINPDEFLAITNARNNQGNTLLQIVIANKHKNIASELVKLLKQTNEA